MGHAVVFGLEEDLGMDPKSNQFNTALTIFFCAIRAAGGPIKHRSQETATPRLVYVPYL